MHASNKSARLQRRMRHSATSHAVAHCRASPPCMHVLHRLPHRSINVIDCSNKPSYLREMQRQREIAVDDEEELLRMQVPTLPQS